MDVDLSTDLDALTMRLRRHSAQAARAAATQAPRQAAVAR
jgi:hypothetical protein